MIIIFGFLEAFYKYCNHWVEIIMVFSSAWYFLKHDCVMWTSCNFSVCESLPSLLPPILSGPQWWSQTGNFSSVYKAQDLSEGSKNVKVPSFSPKNKVLPTPQMQGRSNTAEKLQFVWITSVWTPSMLSCLQVNLSWGICHGSSCFCI